MADEQHAVDESTVPTTPAAPIQSRFLFVDIAARRANQLKRGARVRLDGEAEHERVPHKLERVAMEEVRHGLVHYKLPDMPNESV